MSFIGINSFIKSVDKNTKLKVDELLELMVLAMDDVYEHNGVKGMNNLALDEDEERVSTYARKLNRICNGLTSSYEAEKNKLEAVRESLRSRAAESSDKLSGIEKEIRDYCSDIEKARAELETVKNRETELSRKKLELEETTQAYEKLTALVAEISDDTLEEAIIEKKAKINSFINALESLKDEEVIDMLFKSPENETGIEIGGNPINNAAELTNWFEKIKETIDKLTNAYETAFLKVLELSSTVYKDETEEE